MGDVVMLAPLKTEVCPAWHLRDRPPHPVGGQCRLCRRDVAMPPTRRVSPICLYCALDTGVIPEQEREPGWHLGETETRAPAPPNGGDG